MSQVSVSAEAPEMAISGEGTGEEYGTGGLSAHMVLLVCTLLYVINFMDRQILPAVLEPMKLDLGLNDSQMGVLQTIFLLSMSLFAFPAAFVMDRWSRKKSLGLIAVIWSIFTFVTGLGRGFLGVFFPRLVVGIGEAGYSSGGIAMVSAAYPEKSRAKVLGVFFLAIPLGGALGFILAGYLSANYGGWRTPFFFFAVPGIILGIAALFLKDYKTQPVMDQSGRQLSFMASIVTLFRVPTLKWMFIGYALLTGMYFAVVGWLPAFLMRTQGMAEDRAGRITGMVVLVAIVASPLGGVLADRWQKRNSRGRLYLAVVFSSLATLLIIPGIFLEIQGAGFILALLWSLAGMMVPPALAAVSQDVVPPGLKAMATGMCVFVQYLLGGAWAPSVVGVISDGYGGGWTA